MISPRQFHQALQDAGVEFFAGVPDSLLKEFGAYVDAALPSDRHLITASEGAAVALASGYHLATGTTPLVYLQNSGLGNMVNPLLSLADPEVYAIPMVLLIGWRGEPGIKDEPQHVKQGRVTPAMLDAMGIPHATLDPAQDAAEISEVTRRAVEQAHQASGPVALLVRAGVFEKSDIKRPSADGFALSREATIAQIIDILPASATIVSTTGKISRELYELRKTEKQGHAADFLTVGSMGHASQIALGISIGKPEKLVVCLDGDGAVIMQMGGLTSIGTTAPKKFVHIILNNGAHESVGGQPTAAFKSDLSGIARAAGYRNVPTAVSTEATLAETLEQLLVLDGPSLLEIKLSTGSRSDLGRPQETPRENKNIFMERLRK